MGYAKKSLQKLNPVKFPYKSDKNNGRVGFIAEEVPELQEKTNLEKWFFSQLVGKSLDDL
jgi:hypothetical protein